MPTTEQRHYYAARGAEARALAEKEPDPKTRAALTDLADAYEKLLAEVDRITLIREQLEQAGGE